MRDVSPARAAAAHAAGSASRTGGWLVLGILLVATGLGIFAVWFQWGQTRRCLAFFGPEAATRIQSAERVELWSLVADGAGIRVAERLDVSQAPGLVHLRRGLIEDLNYDWGGAADQGGLAASPPRARLPAEAWDQALAFFADSATDGERSPQPAGRGRPPEGRATVLAFDDDDGVLTVVGRPGRVDLGRLKAGLRTWVNETRQRGGKPGETGL